MALRLGLVGRGRWGRNIERTLLTFSDVALSLIARGETMTAGLDGVLVATPSHTHAEVALPYIEAGIPTFIEKPMTTTLADAERLREAAARSGSGVFVGHIFLFHPAFIALLDLLPSLGAIHYLLFDSANNVAREDSSVLWDWLPHHLSMARAILEREADSVMCRSLVGGEDPAAALTQFEFGATPVISFASWVSQHQRRLVTVAGENGTLVFDDRTDRRLAVHKQDGDVAYPSYSGDLPLSREMAAFVDMIRSGKSDPSHLNSGLAIVGAIAAAEESMAVGGLPVAIAS